jgi:biotin transport system permease protein
MLSLTSEIATPYHRIPASVKLGALTVASGGLFFVSSIPALCSAVVGVGLAYLLPGPRFAREGLRNLRPMWLFLLVIALWHGLTRDVGGGAVLALRLVATVALANLVTMTTRLDEMLALIDRLLRPLRAAGINTAIFGLAVALVIRFTPVLIGKAEQIGTAWRARSPRRPVWRITLPLTLAALDDADHVAEALRARGGAPAKGN